MTDERPQSSRHRCAYPNLDHERYVSNVLDVWAPASNEDHVLGSTWYAAEADFADALASAVGLRFDTVAAIHAVLSPRVNTVLNRRLTRDLLADRYAPTFDRSVAKCLAILDADSPHVGYVFNDGRGEKTYATSTNGPKVVRFWLTILSRGAHRVAVVDRHMVDILKGSRLVSDSVNLDTETQYRPYEMAIIDAADRIGVPIHVLQAVTWISWRRIHGIVDSYTEMEEF